MLAARTNHTLPLSALDGALPPAQDVCARSGLSAACDGLDSGGVGDPVPQAEQPA